MTRLVMSRHPSFRHAFLQGAVAIGALGAVILALAGWKDQDKPAPAASVSRGEYLVHSVAMCVQCHSPRDERGEILVNRKFEGAPMPVRGPAWMPNDDWCHAAPPIAGLRGFTDEQFVMLLTQGHAGDRPPPRRPMPPFRMSREDAQAILQYLRTQ